VVIVPLVAIVPLENLEMFEGTGIILLSFSSPMLSSLTAVFATLSSVFRSRSALQLENLALRHQIGVLQRAAGSSTYRKIPINWWRNVYCRVHHVSPLVSSA